MAHHRRAGRAAGLSDEQIDSLAEYAGNRAYNALDQTVIRFAEQLTREVKVDKEVIDTLKASFDSEELVELAVSVASANFTNRINHAFDIPLEE